MSAAICLGRGAVERDHADAELDPRRRGGELGQRLQPLGAGVVVGPDRVVAELCAARGERPRDLGVEPGGDAEARGPTLPRRRAFSNSATHSMCGVWGNMSTGRTRRSL